MRHFRRPWIVLLAAVHLAACSAWQGRLEGPREALADADIGHVRLTLTSAQTLEMRVAEVRGDTIYGTLGGQAPISCDRASDLCNARVPLTQVSFLESRAFSIIRTAAIVGIPLAIVAIAASAGHCRPLQGNC